MSFETGTSLVGVEIDCRGIGMVDRPERQLPVGCGRSSNVLLAEGNTGRGLCKAGTPSPRRDGLSELALNRYDRDLVRYIVAWLPYGGPSETEIFEQFGVSLHEALRRALDVAAIPTAQLGDEDRMLIEKLADGGRQIRTMFAVNGGRPRWGSCC